jgi:tRNA 2-thiouridine synthesizing protein D
MADYPDFVITLAHNNTNSKQVTLAFTLGLKGLERGHKTAIFLLLDGVNVGRTDYVNDIDIGEPFLAVKDMLDVYLHQGGQLMICISCWKHEKFTEDDRLAGTVMISADQVIDILLNAKSTLQLN